MARLGIISSHDIFVAGLQFLLGSAGHQVVSVCTGSDGVLAEAGCLQPEIVILSPASSAAGSLLETIVRLQHLRKPPKLVLLIEHPTDAGEIANLNVDGIVVSSPNVRQLLECIENVERGRRWMDPGLSIVLESQRKNQDSLTSREQQIVEGVVRGLRNKEIAREMKLREGTVKVHLHHIFDKLKLESRTQLVLAFSTAKALQIQRASTNPARL